MSGQIRSVTLDDAAAIQAIYAHYVTETIISFEATPPTVDEMAARIKKTVNVFPWLVYTTKEPPSSQAAGYNNYPAADDCNIAGYVYASTHSDRAAYQWSVNVSVYIQPAYQRRYIGRGLYTALFELLRHQGFVNAYAGISLPNAGSVGIHTALGFELVGVYHNVGYKFGAWHDVGWWGLQLTEPVPEPLPPRPITEFVDTPLWSAGLQQGERLIRDR